MKKKTYSIPTITMEGTATKKGIADDFNFEDMLAEISNVKPNRPLQYLGIHPQGISTLKKLFPPPPSDMVFTMNTILGLEVVIDVSVPPDQIKIVDSAGGITIVNLEGGKDD